MKLKRKSGESIVGLTIVLLIVALAAVILFIINQGMDRRRSEQPLPTLEGKPSKVVDKTTPNEPVTIRLNLKNLNVSMDGTTPR